MENKGLQFDVLSAYRNTAPFLGAIQESADKHTDALGFYAKKVFEEFARRDLLYVIIESSSGDASYAGHLLFDQRFPRCNIRQMFTAQKYRHKGLARKLLTHLKDVLTQQGFTSIYARVAEDLVTANQFWEQQQFYIQRVDKGGVTKNRQILVRCHELLTPQLFPASGIDEHNPLGLSNAVSNVIPLFLLDLNVLYDLAPRRLRREEAVALFQAERMDFCRLAISSEIRAELERTMTEGRTDPMEAYIRIFPSYPLVKNESSDHVIEELAALIFPEKKDAKSLNSNEKSDLRHVATAIQNDLAGLITNDHAILAAAPKIKAKYGVDAISPSVFKLDVTDTTPNNEFETLENSNLKLQELTEVDTPALRALFDKVKLTGSEIAADWFPTGNQKIAKRYVVWNNTVIVGYLIWWSAKATEGLTNIRIAVDETNSQATNAARVLLIYILDQLTLQGLQELVLDIPPHQSIIRELASNFGFRGTPNQQQLTKLVLGCVLTRQNWSIKQGELATNRKLKLPLAIPEYRSVDQHIQILTPNGNKNHVTLDMLESLLAPALLCLPGRLAVITPLERKYAEPLLGHSQQTTFLPNCSASSFLDRHYISNWRTLPHFKRGSLILFYESGRHGAVVAIARVRQAYLKSKDALDESDFKQSVLNKNNLNNIGKSEMKTVTHFDNIFPLHKPVPLKFLQMIGCGKPNQLISTRPITDQQLQEILKAGFNHG